MNHFAFYRHHRNLGHAVRLEAVGRGKYVLKAVDTKGWVVDTLVIDWDAWQELLRAGPAKGEGR